jgi:hypothetical protein
MRAGRSTAPPVGRFDAGEEAQQRRPSDAVLADQPPAGVQRYCDVDTSEDAVVAVRAVDTAGDDGLRKGMHEHRSRGRAGSRRALPRTRDFGVLRNP